MQSKFEEMSHLELRSYILEHREDEEAFQIYLDRVLAEPGEIHAAPQTIEDLKDFPQLLEKNHRKRKGTS